MKTPLAIFIAALFFVFTSCNNQQTTTQEVAAPSTEEINKKAYIEIMKAFETSITDSLGNYVSENLQDHGAPLPGITSTGLQRLKDVVAFYNGGFPDAKLTYHTVLADGDIVMGYGTWSGTNSGPFMGAPATGKPINVESVDVLRFENGKATDFWHFADQVAMLTQLGIMPQQGPAPVAGVKPAYDTNTFTNDTASAGKEARMKQSFMSVVAIVESGDHSTLDQYLAADFKENMQIPGVTFAAGIEGAKQAMTMFKQAYPNLKMDVKHIAAEGDFLMAYFTVTGTYSGSIPGFPAEAAGKPVKVDGLDIVQFNAEDKGIAHWGLNDSYTELVQLGVIPSPADTTAAK